MEGNTLIDLLKIKAQLIEVLIKKELSPEEIRFVFKKAVETSEEAYNATIKTDNQLFANLMARYADKKGVDVKDMLKMLDEGDEDELEE